ncbi:Crp/Fnr family transcriptional regulator [Tamlana sp. s12]|uniref:Crp/Fnr family transcriptional regulator n=1 Tax=Tamlana sp. s12 TaxID=1630406 RepID=UPI000801EBEC|nr:Crp/Fnr family transcriptional regulator [Tamlana sp. s12]OBQ56441.1 transcriptional regulator [Tamlana sp. s12]QQY81934.1 Crp/Fnr family transcriptional regulator [Tamlana sp. s12]
MEHLWYLDDVNVFKILCPHKFKSYKACHNFDVFQPRDYIYFEKDHSCKMFLIEKGKVKIGYYTAEGDEVVKAVLRKGDVFGEKALLGEEERNEFAQALLKDTVVCSMKVSVLHDLMRDNKTFSLKIYKLINFRIRKLERRLQLLLFKDVRTRLMEFLQELCDEYGVCCEKTGTVKISHPYTQKDMASLIGTSRPTINTIMNELRDENLIEFNRNEILVLKKTS